MEEEVQLYPFFNLGARWSEWSTPLLPDRFTTGKDINPVPTVQEAGWTTETGGENLTHPTGFHPRTV